MTGNQSSLQLALTPGAPMRVCAQDNHAFGIERPFTTVPAPAFDVVFLYQHGKYPPYLPEELDAIRRVGCVLDFDPWPELFSVSMGGRDCAF